MSKATQGKRQPTRRAAAARADETGIAGITGNRPVSRNSRNSRSAGGEAKPKQPPPFTVFLDRDGVLDQAPRITVFSWRQFRWLPGAREAMARLNKPHLKLCLATNQPYAGLGLVRLQDIHAHMLEDLRESGGRFDRIEASRNYFGRRHKPRPGMLEDGGRALGTDPQRAVMVGDNLKDAEAGNRYGCRAILLATTHSRAELEKGIARKKLEATIVADLGEAVDLILAWSEA